MYSRLVFIAFPCPTSFLPSVVSFRHLLSRDTVVVHLFHSFKQYSTHPAHMWSTTLILAAAGIAAAAPQAIDFSAVKALPTPVQGPAVTAVSQAPTYNPSAAASSAAAAVLESLVTGHGILRRDACTAEPSG